MLNTSKRTIAIVFAALLAALVVLYAATAGIGKPSLPSDDAVAFVEMAPDGEVTPEEFDAAIEQAAARQGVKEVPEPGDPQYDGMKEAAVADLLIQRWWRGEAQEQDIEIADREIDAELQRIIEDQFGGEKEFDKFLKQSSFSEEEARERVELQLITTRLQEDLLGTEAPDVPQEEIEAYYNDNIEQFETPETRDVRTLLNPDEEKAQDALEQLQDDDSAENWKQVTKKLSTDEATSGLGGLRQGVVRGQNDPALDEAIFTGDEGELVGPIETAAGFYVAQVSGVTAAATQPLDEQTSEQIRQTLGSAQQQETAAAWQAGFLEKWGARTICADDFMIDRCGNAPPPPDACAGDDEGEEPQPDPVTGEPTEGCPAFVPSTRPVPPSSAGTPGAVGLPQGPQDATAAPVAPAGSPLGVPGAPATGAPPGTAPPATGAPPQTGAPAP